jgi:hypothetical protein
MREDAAADGKLRVFVSYSGKDEAFAQELVAGLERDQKNEINVRLAQLY